MSGATTISTATTMNAAPAAVAAPPLRVTFFSDAEYFGGAEGYLSLLAARLDPRRYQLSAVVPSVAGAEILADRMKAHSVAVHRFDRMGLDWPRRVAGAARALREVGGEVLHLNLPSVYDGGVSSVVWAARRAGYQRVVTTEHLPMVDRKYRQFPVKLLFTRGIESVIVNTRSNRDFLVRRHGLDPDRIVIIENGVEDPPSLSAAERAAWRRGWGADDETVVLGIVGRLTLRKGHHFLLSALASLSAVASLPPWKLVVVGDGEEMACLQALGAELTRRGRVLWLGHREDAPQLMRAFDLLALPSTLETMPFAIIEGMAAGLPVVASAIYGIPELIVDNETGYLLPPGKVDPLRDRLLRLLRDPGLRARLGAAGRRRFEARFTADRMAQRTAALYEGIGRWS